MSRVTVIILNYNGIRHISSCLRSVLNQSHKNYDVTIVDNASTDGSVGLVKKEFPMVKVIVNPNNLGYAEGNNAGIKSTNSKYVAILNYDTEVDGKWLSELLKPLEKEESVAFSTPKILLYDDRRKINTCGNAEHFAGFAFCRGLGESDSKYSRLKLVNGFSGCAFLARREALERLGYFDPEFFAYLEDADLSWRALLAGYKIVYVPTSIVYHKYSASMTPLKFLLLERNRYILLLKHFRAGTLIALLPALILAEALTWGYAIKSRHMRKKVEAYTWILRRWRSIIKKRRVVQALRNVSDKELLNILTNEIPLNELPEGLNMDLLSTATIKVINTLFRICYVLVRGIT